MTRRTGVTVRAVACAVATVLCACTSNAPGKASQSPGLEKAGGAGGAGEFTGDAATMHPAVDELDSLSARVDQSWLELEALDDLRTKAATAGGAEPSDGGVARCVRIRGLADEICTLSDRMCTLAAEHPGQARYTDACTSSAQTCSRARAAAERCPAD
jgi:hypothetical protein